jgi:cysteine-S-conjugate beta-lyase
MDFNGLGIDYLELARILKEEANLFFDDGHCFGDQGKGFERWNLACPTKYIDAALDRLKTTLDKYI